MRIAVFGSGGVGGFFGGRLARAGEEVFFLARGEHLRAIRERGLTIESPEGDFEVRPARATEDPAEIGPVDLVLLGVKAWQVPEAARQMRPLIGPGTAVLPLQNGVEAPRQLVEELGAGPVLGGLCHLISRVDGPGRIHHVGARPHIALGELDDRKSERVATIVATLRGADIAVDNPPSIQAALWEKFLFIAAVSGVGAVTRAPIGVLRSMPETRELLRQAMEEIHRLAGALGVPLAPDAVGKTLAFVDSLPPGGTASMQRDVMDGRPSELESQNGAVVRLAAQAGVEVPLNRVLYGSLLPAERKARDGSWPRSG